MLAVGLNPILDSSMSRNISTEKIKYMKVSTIALSEDLPFVQMTGTEAGG